MKKILKINLTYEIVIITNRKKEQRMEPAKKRKKRSTVANVAGRDFVSFSELYRRLAKDVSLKTFKGILESKGVKPSYESGSTQWYDLKNAEEAFVDLSI